MLSLTTAVTGELEDKLRNIAKSGFTGIEFCDGELANFSGSLSDISKMIAGYGLTVTCFQKFSGLEGLAGKRRLQAFDRLEKKFDLMEAVGGELLLVCSSEHPQSSADLGHIAADLRELAERAQKRNIRVAYLAVPWGEKVRTEKDALALIEEVNSPHLGLALNSLFSLGDGSKAARLRDIPAEKIFHVQLADGPFALTDKPADLKSLSRNFLLPGQGELNLTGFVSLISRAGYRGNWSLASVNDLNTICYGGHTAIDGYRALVSLLDEVARQEPEAVFPIPSLPERLMTSGFEFIEFTVDEGDAHTLENLLTTLRFRLERRHRSQEVTLWRQGAVNILIKTNRDGKGLNKNGTGVTDMGLRVEDAGMTVARASALGAEIIQEPAGTGELTLPAVRGAGDHIVHFIDEKSNLHQMWNVNFIPLTETAHLAPAGIRRIDHVAQTMGYEQMQSWLLYYLTTFAMNKSSIVDVADPFGVIRSQVLATAEGEVRLNLNASSSPHTLAGSFQAEKFGGVQHIAFLTEDIFETSDLLEESGFERLRLPENYYNDLTSIFDLDEEKLERLREGNILYDCDESGEYYQIYSPPVFRGFFFEIVERNSYDGYGARNAPFRLHAQRKYLSDVKGAAAK